VTYSASASVPSPGTVTLTATSVADGTKSAAATITVTAAAAVTVTLSLATANVPVAGTQPFTATVANDSASKGVTWALSGAECTGAVCGTVTPTSSASGAAVTYTAPASLPVPPAVTLTATSVTDTTKTAAATITITAVVSSQISVTLTPKRGGLTLGQPLNLAATVANDIGSTGVTWTASTGTFSAQTAATATYVAPASPGSITVTATSIADATKSASATIGVTDLAGVTTYHNDLSRDGANVQEYALNTTNVATATFGKLFSCAVDGAVYAQPLWVPNLSIGGGTHNVIVVATMHDSVYVFDADANPCMKYWSAQLTSAGETYGNYNDVGGSKDIYPDIGITGTPVIDPSSNTIYLVAKTKPVAGGAYHQRLHALSLVTGAEAVNSPVEIAATITGNCEGMTTVSFNPASQNQRPALALVNGVVYVSWGSHGDVALWHGWLLGYSAANLTAAPTVFNTSPNAAQGQSFCSGGIWMSGGAPAADAANNLYLMTGNGIFDPSKGAYGDSFLRMTAAPLAVADYFTPSNESTLDTGDIDVGSGGTALLIDQTSGPVAHLLVGASKASVFYVLNRDNLGKFSATKDAVVQEFGLDGAAFSTPGFWNNNAYYFGTNFTGTLAGESFAFTTIGTGAGTFNTTATQHTASKFGFAGATPSISASSATANGIVWAIDAGAFGVSDLNSAVGAGPAVLHAFDANNLSMELWNSSLAAGGRDTAGNAVKFTVPTVANGKVYVGTRGSDNTLGGGTTFGQVDVYGLLPN
jgi:hypothetical protein